MQCVGGNFWLNSELKVKTFSSFEQLWHSIKPSRFYFWQCFSFVLSFYFLYILICFKEKVEVGRHDRCFCMCSELCKYYNRPKYKPIKNQMNINQFCRPFIDKETNNCVSRPRMQSIDQSIKRYKHPAVYSIKKILVSNFKNRVFKFRPEMLVLFWKKKQCFESPCTTRQTFQQHDWFKLISTIHMNLINFIAARSH